MLEIFVGVFYLSLQLCLLVCACLVASPAVVVVVGAAAAAASPMCRSKQKSYSAVSVTVLVNLAEIFPDSYPRSSHFQNGPYLNVASPHAHSPASLCFVVGKATR